MVARLEPTGEPIQVQGPMIRVVGARGASWFRASAIFAVSTIDGDTYIALRDEPDDVHVLHSEQEVLNALREAREQ
jgi:hypothetical protein